MKEEVPCRVLFAIDVYACTTMDIFDYGTHQGHFSLFQLTDLAVWSYPILVMFIIQENTLCFIFDHIITSKSLFTLICGDYGIFISGFAPASL